jgi:hypothetical protein
MGIFGRLIYFKTYRPITLFTIMLTVYSIHYLCNPPHTKTNTNSQAHVSHPCRYTANNHTRDTINSFWTTNTFNISRTRRNPLRPPIICDSDGQPIDPVELGPTFNQSLTCIIIYNAGILHYSALETFIDRHEAIFRLNAGPPQPQSDVGAGTSARIINSQLKAMDFKDDVILQWKPGHWSNLPKDTAPACRPGGGIYTIPPLTQWTAWTYLQEWAAEEIHPHPPTTGFLTFFIVSHFCSVVTLVHFHMYARLGTCHYWTNEHYAACYTGHWHPIGWEKAFCSFHMDTKGELFPFVMLINSSSSPWNSSLRL